MTETSKTKIAALVHAGLRFDPSGKSPGLFIDPSVKRLSQKYSDFQNTQITLTTRPVLSHRGRLEIVTDAGQDAVDADAPLTNGA